MTRSEQSGSPRRFPGSEETSQELDRNPSDAWKVKNGILVKPLLHCHIAQVSAVFAIAILDEDAYTERAWRCRDGLVQSHNFSRIDGLQGFLTQFFSQFTE